MTFVKPTGGVAAVALLPASALGRIAETAAGIAVGTSAARTELPLIDDMSRFDERLRLRHGLQSVVHRLTVAMPEEEYASRRYDALLSRAAREGVAARITMLSGRILWAGCSERFAAERALRLKGTEVDNGQSPGERGRVVLTFEGEDCTFAREENATGKG